MMLLGYVCGCIQVSTQEQSLSHNTHTLHDTYRKATHASSPHPRASRAKNTNSLLVHGEVCTFSPSPRGTSPKQPIRSILLSTVL